MDCQNQAITTDDPSPVPLSSWMAERSICDLALDKIKQGLCVFDGRQQLKLFNRRYAEMYGIEPGMLRLGMSLRDVVRLRYAGGFGFDMPEEEYWAWRNQVSHAMVIEISQIKLRNGSTYEIYHEPLPDGGWVASVDDITERLQREEQIRFLAHHDALTGLANRVLFRERLEQAAKMNGPPLGAVLYLDLDRFKAVNDTLGHSAGDLLLQEVVSRVRRHLRAADLFARLGGDEFAILLNGSITAEEIAAIAGRIVSTVALPFVLYDHRAQIGVSIGIALAPRNNQPDGERLMRCADIALYRAKALGRGTYVVFDPGMETLTAMGPCQPRTLVLQRRSVRNIGKQLVKPGFRYTPARGPTSAPSPARPVTPAVQGDPVLSPA